MVFITQQPDESYLRTERCTSNHGIRVNSGISGEQAASLRADFEWRVLRFRPDIVSIMIGMNDAAAGALPILHRINPVDPQPLDANDTSSRQRADLPAYNEIIAQVAHDTNTILIDHWA